MQHETRSPTSIYPRASTRTPLLRRASLFSSLFLSPREPFPSRSSHNNRRHLVSNYCFVLRHRLATPLVSTPRLSNPIAFWPASIGRREHAALRPDPKQTTHQGLPTIWRFHKSDTETQVAPALQPQIALLGAQRQPDLSKQNTPDRRSNPQRRAAEFLSSLWSPTSFGRVIRLLGARVNGLPVYRWTPINQRR